MNAQEGLMDRSVKMEHHQIVEKQERPRKPYIMITKVFAHAITDVKKEAESNEKEKLAITEGEISVNFKKTLTQKVVKLQDAPEPDPCSRPRAKPHEQKTESENHRLLRNSDSHTKTDNDNNRSHLYLRSNYNDNGRSVNKPKPPSRFYCSYSKVEGQVPKSSILPGSRGIKSGSQDDLDLNRNWDNDAHDMSSHKPVKSDGFGGKGNFWKNQAANHKYQDFPTFKNPLSRSQDSLVDCPADKNDDEGIWKNDKFEGNAVHNSYHHRNPKFTDTGAPKYYKTPYPNKGGSDRRAFEFGKRNGSEGQEKQNGFRSNLRKERSIQMHSEKRRVFDPGQRKKSNFNLKQNTSGKFHNRPSDNWNLNNDSTRPPESGNYDRINDVRQPSFVHEYRGKQNGMRSKPRNDFRPPQKLPETKIDSYTTSGHLKSNSNTSDMIVPRPSSNWGTDDSASVSDEPQETEVVETKPEENVIIDSNIESVKSPPITFPFDAEPNSSSNVFFALDSNYDKPAPIPAPHPVAVADEVHAAAEEVYVAADEVHDASELNEDVSSVFSENVDSYGTYTASSEGETSESEENSNAEEHDYQLEPEKIKVVTDYLKQVEIEATKEVSAEVGKKTIFNVNGVLKYYTKGNEISLYGSYYSGLAVSTSNINLALKSDVPAHNSFLLFLQKKLSKDLKGYDVIPFEHDGEVKNSKICFYESESGVACEIMYLGKTVLNYTRTSKLLKSICEYDPRIKTLITASRIWAEVCVIHETENGLLHPLGLALLVVHFLQQVKPPVLPIIDTSSKDWGLKSLPEKNTMEIGALWFKFLKYFSQAFNWTNHVVTVDCKETVLKSSLNWEPFIIAIKDPCSEKNVAASITSYENSEYLFSCFKAYFEFFSRSTNNSDCDSDNGKQNSANKKWKYSFNDSNINRPLPVFCEACLELDEELCEKCHLNQPSLISTVDKLPELSEMSIKCIDKALLNVYNECILSEKNMKGRVEFVKDLETYIRKIIPTANLKLFGSSVNMFGFKNSDLDICMTLSNKTLKDIKPKLILNRITFHLRKNGNYEGVFGLYLATVPIVKFHCPSQRWNCDLSLYNVLSVHNSKLLSKYALIDERCRILGCALKHLAMKGWIADSADRSLSSYSYILMIIHYLQQTKPPILPVLPLDDREVFIDNEEIPMQYTSGKNYWFHEDPEELRRRYMNHPRNDSSIVELWTGFLEYYLTFDNNNAVTITQKEPMLASHLSRCARLFNIEDPFIKERNLGCIVSEEKAERSMKIFRRARSLFGHNILNEKIANPQRHYFSTNNLTGQYGKEMECTACGAFTHEKENCLKANPFKKYNLKIRNPNTNFSHKRRK